MKSNAIAENTQKALKAKLMELHKENKIDLEEAIDEKTDTLNLDIILKRIK
ncbi:hypothetical protein ACMG4J_22665 [Rossellomorea marisflavi]|uniref:hypothetical protein n=1 Tax=Rossellomorea marisflavi TaxID=189381 RepID=UPI0039BEEFF4